MKSNRKNELHFVKNNHFHPPFPDNAGIIYLGMGCFWGAERLLWNQPYMWTTAVGYAYEQIALGTTHYDNHVEVVLTVYMEQENTHSSLNALLKLFWESHDPTQGMRQGNDYGPQYKSVIYTSTEAQLALARTTCQQYQKRLSQQGFPKITTEIRMIDYFCYAKPEHQQYLAKNPEGYCGIAGTGICL